MTQDQTTKQDPTTRYPQPEQPQQQLEHPGLEPDTSQESSYINGETIRVTGGVPLP